MICKLVIPGRLPGMNEYTKAKNRHWAEGNRMKKQWQDYVCLYIAQQTQGVEFKKPVFVSFAFFEPNRRRDEDNIEAFGKKVIFDALVQRSIVRDDRRKYVKKQESRIEYDKKNPRIEVVITDEQEDVL